jgi:ABC-type transport system involved in multi-copper enzyme maturation permease subunit
MARVGKNVITAIIGFQFIAAQLIAVVMLSTSISAEIRQRTLSVLMTTPVNSLQIVMGKLLSQLLQTVLLLGISLPLLAIVRVLGGVPWDYVVSSLCITLTAAVFAGSLSLFMSIRSRHAYSVVLRIVVGYLIVFGALPGLMLSAGGRGFFGSILFHGNPFMMMLIRTFTMLSLPGRAGTFSSWPLHCAIMLAATVCVVALAVWRVRRVALTEAFGGRGQSGTAGKGKAVSRRRRRREALPIRRVDGPPIVWKEMRKPFSRRGRRDIIMYAVLGGVILVSLVRMFFAGGAGRGMAFGLLFSVQAGFSLIIIVRLAVLSASSVTSEKEAGTWPILLATPLDDTDIVRGKAIAAFRRNLPLLIALVVLQAVSWLLNMFGGFPIFYSLLYIIQGTVTLAGTVVLVIGLGLYFSVRLKSSSSAIAATVGVYIGLGYFCCGMFSNLIFLPMASIGGGIAKYYMLVQIIRTVITGIVYAGFGILALRRARRRLRCSVF